MSSLHLVIDPNFTQWGTHLVNINMLKLLLASGADVERWFSHWMLGECNALQLMFATSYPYPHHDDATRRYYNDALSLLLENGADPNVSVIDFMSHDCLPCVSRILTLRLKWQEAFSKIKCLVLHGANLEALDEYYNRFIDLALSYHFNPPADVWKWLFHKGLRIHSTSITDLYHTDNVAHSLRTEICHKSTYYTPRARMKAAKFNPQWGFVDKYLKMP